MYGPSEYSSWRLTSQVVKQSPLAQNYKPYFCVRKRSSSSSSSNGCINSSISNNTSTGMSSSGIIIIIIDTTNRTNSSSDDTGQQISKLFFVTAINMLLICIFASMKLGKGHKKNYLALV